jgi:hypothetical protein
MVFYLGKFLQIGEIMNTNTIEVLTHMQEQKPEIADAFWHGRSIDFLKAISHTDIDIRSDTLLEDLERNVENDAIRGFLEALPGWREGGLPVTSEHLSYASMLPKSFAISKFGPIT